MKRFLVAGGVALALSLAGTDAWAQFGAARGKVLDDKDQPVPEATVVMELQTTGLGKKVDTKTNKKGEYTQVGLPGGDWKITVTKDGFQGSYITYKISIGEATQLPVIKLTPKAAALAAAGQASQEELTKSFDAANALMKAGKHDEAIAAYRVILEKTPSAAEVWYNLGYTQALKKDWAAAEVSYKKALEQRSDFSEATSGLADVYRQTGRAAEAEKLLADAAGSGDAKALFGVGLSHLNAGRSQEAYDTFTKVIAADANNAEAYYYAGTTAVALGKTEEAVSRLEKYLSMNPTNAQNVATAQGLVGALKPKK